MSKDKNAVNAHIPRHYRDDKKGMVLFVCICAVICLVLSIVPLSFLVDVGSPSHIVIGSLCILLLAGMVCALTILVVNNLRRLEDIKMRDPVTSSLSYESFLDLCSERLNQEKGSVPRMLVHFNLDRFKLINDSCGFTTGDELLRRIFVVLESSLDNNEYCCRSYADHFVLLLCCNSRETMHLRLQGFADRCRMLPSDLTNCPLRLVARAGVFEIHDWAMEVRTMDERANIACHEASDQHQMVAFYDDKSLQVMLQEQNIESSMEQALSTDQFLLYLQPKYLLSDMSLCGAEALVRWMHPTRGLLQPYQFIPTLERTGFIRKIDLFMFEQVCLTIRRWLESGTPVFPISVNLSRCHLDDLGLVHVLSSLVRYYGIPCELLELEITENSFRDDEAAMLRMLTELKHEGFSIAMDDFGTGYSTLNILKDIPLDTLKLDKGFLDECVESERGRSVIRDVVTMARHLNMHVICEGVETQSQFEFLRDIGCEIGQGFYFAYPVDVPTFEGTILEGLPVPSIQLEMDLL